MADNTNFTIPRDGYLVFDALNLKQFIKDRLTENNVFTDQNYEGSYLSTIIEVIAYTFHALMYYLNRTSTETLFSEAQLYENMSRIVSLLDYKPVGRQSATLSFGLSALENYTPGLYTIPRYSYIQNDAAPYSFNEDITWAKTTPFGSAQPLTDVSTQKLLYQGKWQEYALYTAVGNENEIIFFSAGKDLIVDHFNIDVYVKHEGTWTQWKRAPTLYMENSSSKTYEIRFNESKIYEIKFGNDINGKKISSGDTVAIYYLKSSGVNGEVGPGAIGGRKLAIFSTTTFDEILADINAQQNNEILYMSTSQSQFLLFENISPSTYYQNEESADAIKLSAPGIFRSQYRLVTEQDYENYIKTNFANLIHDTKVVNNWTYITEQLKYYYDLGLKDPNNVSNILYNQIAFADGCNFNNVYGTIIPKTINDTKNPTSTLTPAQKELIISSIKGVKTLTSEFIVLDPVYIAADVCLPTELGGIANTNDVNYTELYIIKNENSRRDDSSIKLDIYNKFDEYFSRTNMLLGKELDVNYLTNEILGIQGVKTFYTRRKDDPSMMYNGLSILVWNPVYPTDKQLTAKNLSMNYFKYLYLNNRESFVNKIVVKSITKVYESIEY